MKNYVHSIVILAALKIVTNESRSGPEFRDVSVQGSYTFKGNLLEPDYFSDLVIEDRGVFVGGRYSLHWLSTEDLSKLSSLNWETDAGIAAAKEQCARKDRPPVECHDYARVVQKKSDNVIVVCGTQGPLGCRDIQIGTNNTMASIRLYTAELTNLDLSPWSPTKKFAVIYAEASLFVATQVDDKFSKIYRHDDGINTEIENSVEFIESFEDDDKVYFVLRETAEEYTICQKRVVSRIAQVCKKDRGYTQQLLPRYEFSSFFKIRLLCATHDVVSRIYFDEVQSISAINYGNYGSSNTKSTQKMFYAVFSSARNGIAASAVCAYSWEHVLEAFTGTFAEETGPDFFLTNQARTQVPNPHPARCQASYPVNFLWDTAIFIRDHQLLHQPAFPAGVNPIVIEKYSDRKFTQIAVDFQVQTTSGVFYDVLYIGLDDGAVRKVINAGPSASNETYAQIKPFIIEEITVFNGESVDDLQIYRRGENVGIYVVSSSQIRKFLANNCDVRKTCKDCVRARDPYCSWDPFCDQEHSGCSCKPSHNQTFVQNLETGLSTTGCQPVNGGESAWTTWTRCSVSCGGGIHNRSRTCTNPVARNWGAYCKGHLYESNRCNTFPCPTLTCTPNATHNTTTVCFTHTSTEMTSTTATNESTTSITLLRQTTEDAKATRRVSSGHNKMTTFIDKLATTETSSIATAVGELTFEGDTGEPGYFRHLTIMGEFVFVGAKNTLYALSVGNLRIKYKYEWQVDNGTYLNCTNEADEPGITCHNFIRVVQRRQNFIMVCGTHAQRPRCRLLQLSGSGFRLIGKTNEGMYLCPLTIHDRNIIYNNGDLLITGNRAHEAGQSGEKMDIYTLQKGEIRLNLNKGAKVRNGVEPHFVTIFIEGQHALFPFVELAEEAGNCGKYEHTTRLGCCNRTFKYEHRRHFPRIGHICLNDDGDSKMSKRFTSYIKARLNCSLPGDMPFYFDIIESASELTYGVYRVSSKVVKVKIFYGVFTTPRDALAGSAVCAFRYDDVREALETGDFMYRDNTLKKWMTRPAGHIQNPHPFNCRNNKHRMPTYFNNAGEFIQAHALVDKVVPSFGDQPLVTLNGSDARFTFVAVDFQVVAADLSTHDVIFVGMSNGTVRKMVNAGTFKKPEVVVVQDLHLFDGAPVDNIKIHRSGYVATLFVVSYKQIKKVPAYSCLTYRSCNSCVEARDPYCSWNLDRLRCEYSLLGDRVQDLRWGSPGWCADWLEWQESGSCSATCGSGRRMAYRDCYVAPTHVNLTWCKGSRKKYMPCSAEFTCDIVQKQKVAFNYLLKDLNKDERRTLISWGVAAGLISGFVMLIWWLRDWYVTDLAEVQKNASREFRRIVVRLNALLENDSELLSETLDGKRDFDKALAKGRHHVVETAVEKYALTRRPVVRPRLKSFKNNFKKLMKETVGIAKRERRALKKYLKKLQSTYYRKRETNTSQLSATHLSTVPPQGSSLMTSMTMPSSVSSSSTDRIFSVPKQLSDQFDRTPKCGSQPNAFLPRAYDPHIDATHSLHTVNEYVLKYKNAF